MNRVHTHTRKPRSLVLRLLAGLITLPILCCTGSVHAITIDDFSGSYQLTSSEVAGTSKSEVVASNSATGGDRQFTVIQSSTNKGATRLALSGSYLRFTLEANKGEGTVVWDGDGDPAVSSITRLGPINLTEDGGDAFVIPLAFFDLAKGKPITLSITIFDSTNTSKSSEVSVSVNEAWDDATPFPIVVPFSLFSVAGAATVAAPSGTFQTNTTLGTAGAGSITSVGAIKLHMTGDAADLYLGLLTTNGDCASVPASNGSVKDECGVCLASPDANKGKDICGICFKGPPGYNYQSSKVFDACGLCPPQTGYAYPAGTKDSCNVCLYGQPPYNYQDPKDSCGLCPSAPNYQNAQDPCGVCFGDGSSCADCSGTPNGGAQIDQCGVCGGDGTTCLDCAGVVNGTSSLDACGVCGGDGTSCLDCNGVVNGPSKLDLCGVCGGNASDTSQCDSSIQSCTIVPATKKVKEFERSLVGKAKAVRSRFKSELARAKRTQCRINLASPQQVVQAAYQQILARSKQIFLSGVRVCGDSCISTSYADEVKALIPEFKAMQKTTLSLARKVKRCYAEFGIARPDAGGEPGVQTTLGNVNQGLRDLIRRCRGQRVCPPKK
jgi:hypothetical protein